MIRIWGRRSSFNVQKVLWLASELGLEFERVPAGGEFGRVNEPEFRALNPNGLVPVLEDDGLAIWESHAILRYLAARYGADDYWPADPGARSHIDRWLDWAGTMLQPAFLGGLFWRFYRTPEPQRQWPVIRRNMQRCAQLFTLLDRELADRPYVAGESFSLADVPTGASLYRYYEMGLETPKLANVEAWYARLQERPAYREHVMIPFGDLQGRPDR